jgi:hypothetical protein
MGKLSYFKRSLFNRFSANKCPCCGSTEANIVDKKLLGLTTLLQCSGCYLRYRFPADSDHFSFQFYQDNYVQSGLTTDLPAKEQLAKLLQSNFTNTEKDFSGYSSILKSISNYLNRNLVILDYGANWGYTCHQFKQMEFVEAAYGYELSAPRRSYGEKNLNVAYTNEPELLKDSIDVLFSSHVIEHMSNPSLLKTCADIVLKSDGIILLTCPNGSDSARLKNPSWSKLWNEVHPNFISDQFLCKLFSDYDGTVESDSFLKADGFNFEFQKGMSSKLPISANLLLIAAKSPPNAQ